MVRDFAASWHPLVESMALAHSDGPDLIRRFSVKGEDTSYAERLTWFSDSDLSMAYNHIAGIEGVETYDARLTIQAEGSGATITMEAEITAPKPRAQSIAEGTRSIFDMGTRAIAEKATSAKPEGQPQAMNPDIAIAPLTIDGAPKLGLSATPEGQDTLCLLLHGIGGGRSNWDAQLKAIGSVCRAVSLDLRGYGDSDLGAIPSTVEAYCDDILRVMDRFNARKLILCGLSYGAWIATSFAMRYPEKLSGLVLSGGCTGMSEAGVAEREAFRRNREVPMSQGKTPADFAPAVVEVIAGPKATDATRAALLGSMQEIPSATYADALQCFTNPTEVFDFTGLTMPVLMMTGEYDRLAPPAEIRGVAERILKTSKHPDVRFEVILDAGHVCNLEQPEAYNAILSAFIARVQNA